MHITSLLSERFHDALVRCSFADQLQDPAKYASMIRLAGNPKFGDYQANCAMPIGKILTDVNPRQVAEEVIAHLRIDDLCEAPEVAGPGFINLKLTDAFLRAQLMEMIDDSRCLVGTTADPKTIIIDYSSPNVAKPMHVGHIRTTVIGNCLAKVLRFLGHHVITDNHLGDWGTQFGIIIYGYKHFGDPKIVAKDPVPELAKLYRIVHQLMGYQKAVQSVPGLQSEIDDLTDKLATAHSAAEHAEDKKDVKQKRKAADAIAKKLKSAKESLQGANNSIAATEADPVVKQYALEHPEIGKAVLQETFKLHSGDQENNRLWHEFLPHCKDEINRVYRRLKVDFDHTLGESFYHPMLPGVVDELKQRGLATESDGAVCVFLDQFDAPMIIQKSDGAYLYATTDLATLKYRQDTFSPDEVLYVVDARQAEHFDKLFAVADKTKVIDAKLVHVSFGTVLGDDGKPMKTRSGTLIGLESLLDDAVNAAAEVVCDPERLAKFDPPMDDAEAKSVSEKVGIGAIKYADLSHDRTSDYKFNLAKMVALSGNTSAYAQYSYARTAGILRRMDLTESAVVDRVRETGLTLSHPAERDLALILLRFEESLQSVYDEYGPNHLVDYVYTAAESFARFNQQCHVMNAETEEIQTTRLALVVMTGRVIKTALGLLGIEVVQRM